MPSTPVIHDGWPPGMILVWETYRWVFRADPDHPPTYAELGNPGDLWLFTEDEARSHMQGGLLVEIAMFVFRANLIDGVGTFVVPYGLDFAMKWLRATVVGALVGGETLNHTFSFSPTGDADAVPTDAASLLTAANEIKDKWELFWLHAGAGISEAVTYQHVVVQSLELTVPFVSGGSNTGKLVQNGPTVLSAAMTDPGTSRPPECLPYEVAAVMTLRTDAAQAGGVSHGRRNRGRTYLGALPPTIMAADGSGLFNPSEVEALGTAFGSWFVGAVLAAGHWTMVVVTKAGLLMHPVTRIEAGMVPDAQRRRRNQQIEAYSTVWVVGE